jgi:parvulin-like peptidyl-prolyl isomerase
MHGTCPSPIKAFIAGPAARLLAILAPLAIAGLAGPAAAAPTEINRIVLRVNDRVITLLDYRERLADQRAALLRSDLPEDQKQQRLAELPRAVMREMLDENLLLSRGDQLGVEISDDQLAAAAERAKKSFGIESDEEFRAGLQASGLTEEDYLARVRDNLLFQEVLGQEVHSQIEISDQELQRYYREHEAEFRVPEQLELREIVVVERPGVRDEEMMRTASEIRSRLDAGEKLEDVVIADVTSGVIELGWVRVDELDPSLTLAAAGLEPGQFSAPARGRGGIHILELVSRQEARLAPFSDVQERLRQAERARRFESQLSSYMRELEQAAYINADPPPEAAGFLRAGASVPGQEGLGSLPPAEPAPEVESQPEAPGGPPTDAPPPPLDKPALPQPPEPPAPPPAEPPDEPPPTDPPPAEPPPDPRPAAG